MRKPREKVALPFWFESLALLIIPFEEALALSIGSMLRIVNFMTLATGIMYLRFRNKRAVINANTARLLMFYLWMVVSVIWCQYDGLYLDRLSTYSLGLALIVVLQLLEPNQRERDLLVASLWISGVIASMTILYSTSLTVNVGGRETIKLFGRQVDPNYLAFSLVLSSVINVCYLLSCKYKTGTKVGLGLTQFILASAIVALGSRGAFLSTVVVMAAIILLAQYQKNAFFKKVLLIGCALSIALVFYQGVLETGGEMSRFTIDNLLGRGEYGTAKRTEIWSYAVEQFKTRPMLGFGMGSAPYAIKAVYRFVGTHNSYLMILLEYGLIGFMLFCVWQILWLRSLCRRKNRVYFFMGLAILCFIMFIEGFPTKAFWGVHIVMFTGTCKQPFLLTNGEEQLCRT